jgi:hypothetical protein
MSRRDRLMRQLYTSPRNPEIDARKQRFEGLCEFIQARGGWMTSIPGDREMRFEALPGSPLPDQLAALGYIVEWTGETQRILPYAVAQKFETSSSGALVAATEGSTKPTSVVVTNAGIATVEQFDLTMP